MVTRSKQPEKPRLLPDFCNNQAVLLVILVAELLAIVLTLNHGESGVGLFAYLGHTSLFIQTVALLDMVLLCYLQKIFNRLTPKLMATFIYIALQLVTLLVTFISFYIIDLINYDINPPQEEYSLTIIRNLTISAIITAIVMRYLYIRHQWEEQLKAENRARIEALEARIRPHFLFNSMNTIASLIHDHPEKAESAVLDLADLFRSTLANHNRIALADELDITRRYLRMEELRLGDRLNIVWDVDQNHLDIHIPALILQPLVENAIYHGIEPSPEGGTVNISIQAIESKLIIKVSNPVFAIKSNNYSIGNQIALENIKQRLNLAYETGATIDIVDNGNQFIITIYIPIGK